MPEGPEVKLSVDLIKPLIQNHVITSVEITSNSRYANELPEGLLSFQEACASSLVRVLNIQSKGKFMYWTFRTSADNNWFMFCTFGMSGQWSPKIGKHPCLIFQHVEELYSNSIHQMVFNDPRHFGTIKFVDDATVLSKKLDELGWDPLSMSLAQNIPWIRAQLKKTNKSIAEVLMDQKIFCGMGNYARAEVLYSCQLNPFRHASSLSDIEINNLCLAAVDVMQTSYQHQGATIHTYKTAYGEEGKYSTLFKVYGKKQDSLGNKIIKQDLGGRTLHWCPAIQT